MTDWTTPIARFGEIDRTRKWEYAIVIQGPYIKSVTDIVIRTFYEKTNDNTLIIISTYESAAGLITQWEKSTVRSQDHRLQYIFLNASEKIIPKIFWETNFRNQNLQRLSSHAGLKVAQEFGAPYTLKCRSDAFLGIDDLCNTLHKSLIPLNPTGSPRIQGRLVISDHAKRQCDQTAKHFRMGDYHIADHWMFGFTEDLISFFHISTDENIISISPSHSVETNLTERWMKEVGIPPTPNGIEEIVARYMVVVNNVDLEFVWMKKWHSYERYKIQGKRHLILALEDEKRLWGPMITRARWLEYVQKYIS